MDGENVTLCDLEHIYVISYCHHLQDAISERPTIFLLFNVYKVLLCGYIIFLTLNKITHTHPGVHT